jgi:hypothetical protein
MTMTERKVIKAKVKGVGRICQQTVIDTYSKVGFAKLYIAFQPRLPYQPWKCDQGEPFSGSHVAGDNNRWFLDCPSEVRCHTPKP